MKDTSLLLDPVSAIIIFIHGSSVLDFIMAISSLILLARYCAEMRNIWLWDFQAFERRFDGTGNFRRSDDNEPHCSTVDSIYMGSIDFALSRNCHRPRNLMKTGSSFCSARYADGPWPNYTIFATCLYNWRFRYEQYFVFVFPYTRSVRPQHLISARHSDRLLQ